MASSDCSVCHETTDWISTALPAGHMPNPSQSQLPAMPCLRTERLHAGDARRRLRCCTPASAAIAVCATATQHCADLVQQLHAQGCRAHADPYSLPVGHAIAAACHTANYVTGGFGPTNMSAAKHAFVPATCDTCHEAGLSFYMGAVDPGAAGPPGRSPLERQRAAGDRRLLRLPSDHATGTPTCMPAGHMPNPGNQACTVCHMAIGSTAASYATLASVAVLHTGISTGCAQCHGGGSAAHLLQQQRQSQGGGADAVAHSVPDRHRLRFVPCRPTMSPAASGPPT